MLNIENNSDKVSRKKKKKKPGRVKKLKIATIILSAMVLVYLGAAVFVGMGNHLSTVVALNGSVQEDIRVEGYIFRDQNIIKAPWDGHFECLVSEGDRVKEGQAVGYIYQTTPDAETIDKIKKLHRMIRLSGYEEADEYIAGGTGVSEKKISELSRDLSDLRQNYNLSEASAKKEEINLLIKRSQSTDSGIETDEDTPTEVELMMEELASLEQQTGENIKIIAETGGVFTSRVDGLEDKLSYESAESADLAYIEELDKIEPAGEQAVTAGQPICKIVNNYTWRYVAVFDEKDTENIKVGQIIQMRFYDLANSSIKGTVAKISEPQDGKCVVMISANRYVEGIYSTSRVSADVVVVDASGIKLPDECLRVKDGVTGVYVIRLDSARFVPVNLIYRNEEWAVVSAAENPGSVYKLQIYDEVIVECRNLEDGKVVR